MEPMDQVERSWHCVRLGSLNISCSSAGPTGDGAVSDLGRSHIPSPAVMVLCPARIVLGVSCFRVGPSGDGAVYILGRLNMPCKIVSPSGYGAVLGISSLSPW